MAEDNLERQIDEVEVMVSMYPDQWTTLDEAARVYSINITDDTNHSLELDLQVTLPAEYPSDSPPQYELSAPWLRGQERTKLCNDLDNIYLDNLGESLMYLWVQHLQLYLADRTENPSNSTDNPNLTTDNSSLSTSQHSPPSSPHRLTGDESDDEDDDGYDDDFDPSQVVISSPIHTSTNQTTDHICPEIHHGGFLKDRKSTFQAHLARVTHPNHVKLVMEDLLSNKKIAAATHNIQAYRIALNKSGTDVTYQGCVDDGEIHAGSRMLHLLQIVDVQNVLVVVTRWYGGIHLGPDRFKHINNLTRQMLVDNQLIHDKNDKKGPKSSKKGKKST